ncbi:MAG: hypothetical protein V3T70_09215, partial [Phycisphaerae bacterium]
VPTSGDDANPTVAILKATASTDPAHIGRFVCTWNVREVSGDGHEIRARYFAGNGIPRGPEFRVHQATFPTSSADEDLPSLAQSAQHTLAYAGNNAAVISWDLTAGTTHTTPNVYFTLLPTDHAEILCGQLNCLRGDTNGDGLIDGDDIQDFVDAMVGPQSFDDPNACAFEAPDANIICRFDINADCDVNLDDLPLFVVLLLGGTVEAANNDCNVNGTPDAVDVLANPSIDCNVNFIPDTCDLAGGTSVDVNTNGVLDECDPDCNANGVLDVLDIDNATSGDCDTNGVPDECQPDCNTNGVFDACDAAAATSLDCDTNGQPDECQQDCNTNGTADTCDIGTGASKDCNNNGFPDDCDVAMLFFIKDCNSNGVPDSCDITAGTSIDADANGIPDECEAQQAQGGGGATSTTTESSTPTLTDAERWAEFTRWLVKQKDFDQLVIWEQMRRMKAKLLELELI